MSNIITSEVQASRTSEDSKRRLVNFYRDRVIGGDYARLIIDNTCPLHVADKNVPGGIELSLDETLKNFGFYTYMAWHDKTPADLAGRIHKALRDHGAKVYNYPATGFTGYRFTAIYNNEQFLFEVSSQYLKIYDKKDNLIDYILENDLGED